MKTLRMLAAGAVLCAGVGVLAADDARPRPTAPSINNLPADVFAGVVVEDISASLERWNNSPLRNAWDSSEMARFRSFYSDLDDSTETDEDTFAAFLETIKYEEFREHIDGFVGFFLTNMSLVDVGAHRSPHIDAYAVAAITPDSHEALQDLIEELIEEHVREDARRSMEEYRDIDVFRIEYTMEREIGSGLDSETIDEPVIFEFAMLDDALIVGTGPNFPVRSVINSILDDDAERLPSNARFRFAADRMSGATDVMSYIDLGRFMDWFEEYGSSISDSDPEGVAEFFRTMRTFGLRDLGAMAFGAGIHSNQLETRGLLEMPRTRDGIVGMIYSGGPNSVETASIVPADVDYYTSFTLDVGPLLGGVRQMMQASDAGQMLMLYDMWRANFRESFGVDFETDVLNNLSGEHAIWTRKKETPPEFPWESDTDFFAALGVTNGPQVVLSLNQLFNRLSSEPFSMPFSSSEQNGFRIWGADPEMGAVMGAAASDVALGLTDRYIVITPSQAATRDTVRRIATGGEEGSLADNEDFQTALARVPRENLRSFAYNTPESMGGAVNTMIENFASTAVMRTMDFGSGDPMTAWEDYERVMDSVRDAMPSDEFWQRYFGAAISTATLDSRAMDMRYVITLVEE